MTTKIMLLTGKMAGSFLSESSDNSRLPHKSSDDRDGINLDQKIWMR